MWHRKRVFIIVPKRNSLGELPGRSNPGLEIGSSSVVESS